MSKIPNADLEKLREGIRHVERLLADAQRSLAEAAMVMFQARAEFCQYPALLPLDPPEGTNHEN